MGFTAIDLDWHTHTLMDMRTDLTAVPHASLRNPNPERFRKVLKSLGVFKRKCGPKRKLESKRQVDVVRAQLQMH